MPAAPLPPEYFRTVFLLDVPRAAPPSRFAIVTAWNPMDEVIPHALNQARDRQLQRMLETLDPQLCRITGCSPDLVHREPGWGFRADLETALAIAREFRQRALWWVENDRLNLVSCGDPAPQPMGSFRARVVGGPVDG